MLLEACVQGIASALAAEAGGADRVELCEDLAVGGVTPSAGTIAIVCRRLTIPVHVLIRPREGDFQYDDLEMAAMLHDIDVARRLGAAGVVLGALTPDAAVDRRRTEDLLKRSRPMSVTFHKAFDATRDLPEALEALMALGVDRVLTSGGAPTAREGLTTLQSLREASAGRIAVLVGGRVALDDLPHFAAVGISEVHAGSALGLAGKTDVRLVRRLALACSGASGKVDPTGRARS